MIDIGLTALGGARWIAGVQYLQSIVYGNSLLPAEKQARLHLYLDFETHRLSDYAAIRDIVSGTHLTSFTPRRPLDVAWRLRRLARTTIREKRWPGFPRSTLERSLKAHQIQVLFGSLLRLPGRVSQISWIPDFQHIHYPEFFSAAERQSRDHYFRDIMTEADRVVVSNQCSRADAARLYPEFEAKFAVLPFTMYLGEAWQDGNAAAVVRKYALPDKFLLLPAQFWKHKNHLVVFEAVRLLRDRGWADLCLVCTGLQHDYRFPQHASELQEFIQRHKLEESVGLLGLLPRNDQVQLMRAAAGVVQPSFFEGWSAVLEEGRSMGKIVFASDIPMHREQIAANVHLFDPKSADELAQLLARHWPSLRAGPDLAEEARASTEYLARLADFADRFIGICRSVTEPQ